MKKFIKAILLLLTLFVAAISYQKASAEGFEDPVPIYTVPSENVRSPNLWFIKTTNTISGFVELELASADLAYKSGYRYTTYFSPSLLSDGVFQMSGNDLYYIKLRNTASGRIEVHSASAASGYRFGVHYASYFNSLEEKNGVFQIVGADLYYIKIRNTGSGLVEVHSAKAFPGYYSDFYDGVHSTTYFNPSYADRGTWQMNGPDVWFIQTQDTTSGRVEVHSAYASDNYMDFNGGEHAVTYFNLSDAKNGTWSLSTYDPLHSWVHILNFVKTRNSESGQIEVHSAASDIGFENFYENEHRQTFFSLADSNNGFWQMGL